MPNKQDENSDFSSYLDENNSEEDYLSEYKSSFDDKNDVCIQYKKSTLILFKDNKIQWSTKPVKSKVK